MPFEGLLRSFTVPNRRCTSSLENVNHVFIEMALRVQALSRGNLAHVGARCSLGAFHIDKRSVTSGPIPGFEFNFLYILDEESLDDGDSLTALQFCIIREI